MILLIMVKMKIFLKNVLINFILYFYYIFYKYNIYNIYLFIYF